MTETYKRHPIILTHDGCLAIGTRNKSEALEFLNEIRCTLLLLGIPVHVIREADLR